MAPRPYNPRRELEGALARGDLGQAIVLAAEHTEDFHHPLALELALRFLPLVAQQRPHDYDAWALRWLARWAIETRHATIDRAAELACSLADGRGEPLALESVRRSVAQAGRPA